MEHDKVGDRLTPPEARDAKRGTRGSYPAYVDSVFSLWEANARLAQGLFLGFVGQLRVQAKANRCVAKALGEQSRNQQRALQALAQESAYAYAGFLNSMLFFRRQEGSPEAVARPNRQGDQKPSHTPRRDSEDYTGAASQPDAEDTTGRSTPGDVGIAGQTTEQSPGTRGSQTGGPEAGARPVRGGGPSRDQDVRPGIEVFPGSPEASPPSDTLPEEPVDQDEGTEAPQSPPDPLLSPPAQVPSIIDELPTPSKVPKISDELPPPPEVPTAILPYAGDETGGGGRPEGPEGSRGVPEPEERVHGRYGAHLIEGTGDEPLTSERRSGEAMSDANRERGGLRQHEPEAGAEPEDRPRDGHELRVQGSEEDLSASTRERGASAVRVHKRRVRTDRE